MAKKIKMRCSTWMNAKQIAKVIRQASVDPKRTAAALVEREAKLSMESGGKRRVRNKKGKTVTREEPSAPGQPPHSQSGVGKGSIKFATYNAGETFIIGPSSPPAPYMAIHEFGGRFHPPRPFMRPALMRVVPKMPSLFGKLALNKTQAARVIARELKKWERDKKKRT